MSARTDVRLEGLEPDNLLAFLALLGLLRALDAADDTAPATERLFARASWDIDAPPTRPRLCVQGEFGTDEIVARAEAGVIALAECHEFGDTADIKYSRAECRTLLNVEARSAGSRARARADLLAALMTDGAVKGQRSRSRRTQPSSDDDNLVASTPLCCMFGQGHQHFLQRLAQVPRQKSSAPVGRGRRQPLSEDDTLADALFRLWLRQDDTKSFRWDPAEDARHALMAGDPTDDSFRLRTQHGANRLAAVAIPLLTVTPQSRAGQTRPTVANGRIESGVFRLAWPIWRHPMTLKGVLALLSHPALWTAGALEHLGVDHVMTSDRLRSGKFLNFSRATVLVSKRA